MNKTFHLSEQVQKINPAAKILLGVGLEVSLLLFLFSIALHIFAQPAPLLTDLARDAATAGFSALSAGACFGFLADILARPLQAN